MCQIESLPPGECLQTGIALRAALVIAGLAADKLVELVEQLAQGVGDVANKEVPHPGKSGQGAASSLVV